MVRAVWRAHPGRMLTLLVVLYVLLVRKARLVLRQTIGIQAQTEAPIHILSTLAQLIFLSVLIFLLKASWHCQRRDYYDCVARLWRGKLYSVLHNLHLSELVLYIWPNSEPVRQSGH